MDSILIEQSETTSQGLRICPLHSSSRIMYLIITSDKCEPACRICLQQFQTPILSLINLEQFQAKAQIFASITPVVIQTKDIYGCLEFIARKITELLAKTFWEDQAERMLLSVLGSRDQSQDKKDEKPSFDKVMGKFKTQIVKVFQDLSQQVEKKKQALENILQSEIKTRKTCKPQQKISKPVETIQTAHEIIEKVGKLKQKLREEFRTFQKRISSLEETNEKLTQQNVQMAQELKNMKTERKEYQNYVQKAEQLHRIQSNTTNQSSNQMYDYPSLQEYNQLLAQNSKKLQHISLLQAQLAETKALLSKCQSQVTKTQSEFKKAQSNFQQMKTQLRSINHTFTSQLQKTKSELREANAQLKKKESELSLTKSKRFW